MFISIDGNSTGKIIETMIFDNNLSELAEFSSNLQKVIHDVSKYLLNNDGNIIMAGGDNILVEIHPSPCYEILKTIDEKLSIKNYQFSIAISETAQGAYMGLKYAKAKGEKIIRVKFLETGQIDFHIITF